MGGGPAPEFREARLGAAGVFRAPRRLVGAGELVVNGRFAGVERGGFFEQGNGGARLPCLKPGPSEVIMNAVLDGRVVNSVIAYNLGNLWPGRALGRAG